ncbi:transposase [Streptomyces sp. MRC013]|uniref:IS701 family transposase n=1 Tax=Streptomyces sp. MRC013 TaxID=2898276 RepID=UPI00202702D1|nr:transposase [Streptomyces sp. MRC013]URM89107.1 transposase [Streptomyces sp. MRC013]
MTIVRWPQRGPCPLAGDVRPGRGPDGGPVRWGRPAYVTGRGRVLTDRRLHLPEQPRCSDPGRRHAAGTPEGVQFQTEPRLAREMIAAALEAGVAAPWVPGGEARGQDPRLRAALEARGTGYVLAVAYCARVRINHVRALVRADTVAERLPTSAWQRQSAGAGAKGPCYCDWAWIPIGTGSHRHLLIRRNHTTGELAFHLCWPPAAVALAGLVRVADVRWSVEECLRAAQGPGRTRSHQVRNWTSWHRHVTLATLAPALPTALAVDAALDRPIDPHHPTRDSDPITLTVPEIRHLPAVTLLPQAVTAARLLHWPTRWRQHQATARRGRYRPRSTGQLARQITKPHWMPTAADPLGSPRRTERGQR